MASRDRWRQQLLGSLQGQLQRACHLFGGFLWLHRGSSVLISGQDGNDRLRGSPGNDTLKGERGGDDVLLGGNANGELTVAQAKITTCPATATTQSSVKMAWILCFSMEIKLNKQVLLDAHGGHAA